MLSLVIMVIKSQDLPWSERTAYAGKTARKIKTC